MSASRQAYARGESVDRDASALVEQAPRQHVQNTIVVRAPAQADVLQVAALFKSVRGARQAMIASIIFGQPKAMQKS